MGEKRGMKALEAWCRKITGGYRDVRVSNMTTAWRDGLAFCAIIHHFQPDLIDFDSLSKENIFHNNNLAFSVAEQRLGIPALLDAEDMVKYEVPDKLSILTYVSQLYQHFHGMEASKKNSPAKRPLDDSSDPVTALAESPGKRSAVEVTSPSPAVSTLRRNDVCHACRNRVYILERLIVDNRLYHRTCFQCCKCHAVLQPGSYVEGDRPDQYECLRCPDEERDMDDGAKRHLGAHVLRRFSETEAAKAKKSVLAPKVTLSARGAVNSSTESPLQQKKEGSRPPIVAKPLEIATAASEARLVFHAQNLSAANVDPTPVTDTGQEGSTAVDRSETMETTYTPDMSDPKSSIGSSATDGVVSSPVISSDVRNNNVELAKKPPVVKPPPPPDSDDGPCATCTSEVNDVPSKPAIPQKPSVIPERPRSLLIRTSTSGKVAMPHNAPVPEVAKMECPVSRVCVGEPAVEPLAAVKVLPLGDPCSSGDCAVPEIVVISESKGTVVENEEHENQESVKPVPVAAPRVSKSKRHPGQSTGITEDGDECAPAVAPPRISRTTVSPEKVVKPLSGGTPTPKKRSSMPNEEDIIVAGREPPPPPKPPRRATGDRPSTLSKTVDYPEYLNPFDDDDDSSGNDEEREESKLAVRTTESTTTALPRKSLNPFDDSDESNEESSEVNTPAIEAAKQNGRRLIPCDRPSLNPFASDGDSEDEEKSSNDGKSLNMAYQHRDISSDSATGSETCRSRGRGYDVGMRKKRPAPQPPSSVGTGSETSSPRLTPCPSPRPIQKSPAPQRPSSPHPHYRSCVPSKKLAVLSPSSTGTLCSETTSIDSLPSSSCDGDAFLTEKSLKELDNMNLTKLGQHGLPTRPPVPSHSDSTASPSLERPLSPDSLESQTSVSNGKPPNTFGNWKRKKRPAPPLPIPRRRQIQKIPMKEIQSELLEIEEKQVDLEKQGVEIEKLIRDKFRDEVDPSDEEEDLILQLFELVNKKNALFRRQTELIYLKRQQRLEEEHADLEFQIRCLMEKPAEKKTGEDRALEEQLINRLVQVVKQRSEIVESMEMDRLREEQEDRSIQEQLSFHRGSQASSEPSAEPSTSSTQAKTKKKEKKKKSKKHETKDEDKDTDEADSSKGSVRVKDKKRKWLFT